MSADELATLSRAFGEIAFQPPEPWMLGYLAAAEQLLPSFRPDQLADLAWGLSRSTVPRAGASGHWEPAFLQAGCIGTHTLAHEKQDLKSFHTYSHFQHI